MTGADAPPLVLGNVLIDTQQEAWAVYRLPMWSYPLLPIARKRKLMDRLAQCAARAGNDLTLWRIQQPTLSTTDEAPTTTREAACYVAVRLDSDAPRPLAMRLLRASGRTALRSAMPRRLVAQILDREREFRVHARASIDAAPATSQELIQLTTRLRTSKRIDPYDARTPLLLLDTDTLIVEPAQVQRVPLASADLIEHPDRVEVHTADGVTHHAALVLGVLPDGLEFPGRTELALRLEACEAECDWTMHARFSSNAVALRRAGRTIVDADNATTEQASTGRVNDTRLQAQLDTAVELGRYLDSDQAPPMLSVTITIVVAAATADALDRACAQVAATLAPVQVVRPHYAQRALWRCAQQPLRSARGVTAQHLTVQQFGALMPVATERVGTETGPIIGEIRTSRRPVRLDISAASRTDRPPSILCVGTLGSGKTMTSQLIEHQALLAGARVVDVDPKHDHRLDQHPDHAARAHRIDLADTEQHAGLLDPLLIADPELRIDVAASFYADLIDATSAQRALLRTALTQLANDPHARSTQLIQQINSTSHAAAADTAEQLASWASSGLAQLALGTRPHPDSSGPAPDLTTIRCRSLTLPDAATPRSDYTESERLSCAIMRLIATFALRIAGSDPSRAKMIAIDEAWVLLGNADGRALIDRVNRTGRSEHATLLLATQQLNDAQHAAPLIGTRLVFGVETAQEASSAATLLGVDDTDEFAHELCAQRAGQAAMRDIDGNLARIQITVPPDLLAHLSTSLDTPPAS